MEFTGEPFALTRAQPNPAASSATVEFTLPFDAETRFELFNASGLLVGTMIDAMMAAGSYSFTIDVQELPSGLYYFRLTSGSKSASHPLRVAK
jgi:hypothetical protein